MTPKYLSVFTRSSIYGGTYNGHELSRNYIKWPESTWMSNRMAELQRTERLYNNIIYLNQMVDETE